MAINSTLKSISGLLKLRDADLQIAAVKVLGAIKVREPGIVKSLGELLVSSGNPAVRRAVLETFEANPHDLALKYLVQNLEKDDATQLPSLDVVAHIGSKAVSLIKQQFARLPQPVQRNVVTVLPRIRTSEAHAFFVECCYSQDAELVRNAVHSLRERIHEYNTREQGDLRDKLLGALKDKRTADSQTALSSFIISLGIIGQVQVKTRLLPYLEKSKPLAVRRHTLMSLARFEYVGARHQDVFEAVLPILNEPEYEELVRHAVQVLSRIKPRRADNNKIRALLDNRHPGVRVYAVQALSQLDSLTNAEAIMALMHHCQDIKLRDAAVEALRTMPSAVPVILKHIDEVRDRSEAFEMVRILESHGNRIKPEKAREMIAHMLDLYRRKDEHYQLYRLALCHLRGDVLQKELTGIADECRKKSDWEGVRDTLKLLDHTELITPEIRFQLVVAKLKTCKRDLSRSFRQADYCLEHISILLREDPKDFRKKLLAEKNLGLEELLYVGYHFAEQTNEERRFGLELLQHLVSKHGRKPEGLEAKKKLTIEGH